jgi:Skp family chaperone for outer membrane proteins
MKKICCVAVLLIASLFAAPDASRAADANLPGKIGVVRMQALYQESQAGAMAMAWLQELQSDMQKRFEDLQARRTAAEEAGDEAGKDAIQVEMQALLYTLQNTINTEQERIFALMEGLVNRSANRYIQENAFAALLSGESLLASAASIDVTADVIALMNQESIDFGPKPSLDLPPAAETAGAGEAQ